MSDQEIEKEIQAKGANVAPRITPADIEANIASEWYFTAREAVGEHNNPVPPDQATDTTLSLLTFCVLVLRNGFTVTGESACASPENFNAEIGFKVARQNAVAKVWPLMGYELKQRLHNLEKLRAAAAVPAADNDFPLGKACDLSGEGACEACQ